MTSRTSISGRLRLSAISLLAVSALAFSGCSNADGPKSGDPSAGPASSAPQSASVTPSASPTPKPTPVYKPADAKGRAQNVPVPVKPPLADKNSKEGLEAFAKYWFQALSYAYETGDTALIESASGPNCRFCSGLQDGLKTAWGGKKWIVGGKIQTPAVKTKFSPRELSQQATVQVIQEEIAIYKAKGTLYQAVTKASNTASQAVFQFDSTGWAMTDLGLIR
ncbi:hypothetical protein SRABI83_03991 [Arthrobacter sp. Bi83]|uniref:DUF6318 family protein n=1 Tax=Arthrobacter sp. Bi83 TaxID=2822353 RepID=UPI001D679300|nr:DUF6318 family protein [Arthrobacter sp. Bi83]CAH0283455.1 hypothetical protein SRABI83_03991 [Arthrobacter sp. Bi83]